MFKMDSRFWQLMTKIGDILLLSVLCFAFALPLITLPLALISLYGVTCRQLDQPEISIVKNYLLLISKNFKKTLLATCLLLLPLVILFLSLVNLANAPSNGTAQFLGIIILLLLIASLVWLLYWLPVREQMPQKLKLSSFSWSFYLAFRHLPWSLLLLALFGGALWLTLQFLPVVFFSLGGFVYLNCLIVKKIANYSYQEILNKLAQ